MEEAAESAAPKVQPFIKGIQKSPNGNEIKIWGVRGDPDEIAKLGYGTDPGSVPEHILRGKGLLPEQVNVPQNAPNAYADGGLIEKIKGDKSEAQKADDIDPVIPATPPTAVTSTDTAKGYAQGGKVERSSLAHPTPNGMMARPMADGGYPHVTFLENESPATVNKVTHVEHAPHMPATSTETGNKDNPKHMAKGGAVLHDEKLKSIYKAMGIKGYDDGGVATPAIDPNAPPAPNSPGWVEWVQNAISKLGNSPVGTAAGMAMNPVSGIASAVEGATPAIMKAEAPAASAVANTMTGGAIPAIPAATPPPAAPPAAPLMPPAAAPSMSGASAAPGTSTTTGMPNIGQIFNQDTSKLTENVNPEDRQALANQLQTQQHGLGAIIAQSVAGLGDAIAAKGGKEQHALGNIFSMEKTQRDEALANFDKARQDRLQKLQLQTAMGDNALKQAAAADAYGVDDHLNSLLNAPKGTMKKDLPTYMGIMSSQIAAKEKQEDLYMKATAQASNDVENYSKNASIFNIKPSPAQFQAAASKLRDQYINKAQGNVGIKASDGSQHWIPAANLNKAKQMDTRRPSDTIMDFSSIGGAPVHTGKIDFSAIGGVPMVGDNEPTDDTTALGAAGRGAVSMLPLGNQAYSAIAGAAEKEPYLQERQELEKETKADIENHEPSRLAGQAAGIVAPALLTGGASAPESLAEAAGQGALIGGGFGAGNAIDTLASGGSGAKAAGDVALGAGLGAAGGAIGQKLAGAAESAIPSIESYAAKKAAQGVGMGSDELGNMSQQELINTGKMLMNKGIVKQGASTQEMFDTAKALQEHYGDQIGQIGNQATELGLTTDTKPLLDVLGKKYKLASELQNPDEMRNANFYKKGMADIVAMANRNGAERVTPDIATTQPESFVTFDQLQQLKKSYGDSAFINGTVKNPAAADVYSQLSKGQKDIVNKVGATPGLPAQLKDAMANYSQLHPVVDGLQDVLGGERADNIPAKGFGMIGKLVGQMPGQDKPAINALTSLGLLGAGHPLWAVGAATATLQNPRAMSTLAQGAANAIPGLAEKLPAIGAQIGRSSLGTKYG